MFINTIIKRGEKMKKFVSFLIIILAVSITLILPSTKDLVFCCKKISRADEIIVNSNETKTSLGLTAKSSILVDARSGKMLYGDNQDKQLAPASMTKVMTMLLVMEEIERGKLSLDQHILVSEYAASQEGSECFLDANQDYTVKELLKSIAVASANDSCVALAEAICGDEKLFVNKMNERAKSLGMTNTHYVNCTGLDVDGHVSTASDLCKAIKELGKYPLIAELEKTWMYDMQHAKNRVTSLTNTNRLVRTNPDCYMAKTGHTDNAGYCIVVLGKRGDMELIACVMGVEDSKERFTEVTKLLNFGFANFEVKKVAQQENVLGSLKVTNGEQKSVNYSSKNDLFVTTSKDNNSNNFEQRITLTSDKLKAPVLQGQVVGKLEILQDGVVVGEAEIVTIEKVEKQSFKDIVFKLVEV